MARVASARSESRGGRWAPLLVLLLLAILVPAPGSAQQALLDETERSPAIAALSAALDAAGGDPLEAFWTAREREGTPLVEPEASRPGYSLVTFLYREPNPDVEVALSSNIVALEPSGAAAPDPGVPLRRLAGTDVRYLTFRLRHDVRAPYRFHVRAPATETRTVPDPLNPVRWEPDAWYFNLSVLELRGAPAQPWRDTGAARGEWRSVALQDREGRSQDVEVYLPPGWQEGRTDSYPALLGLSVASMRVGMRVDRMVDHLIDAGALPPIVVALVDVEADGDAFRYEPTDTFVAETLLPYLRTSARVSAHAEDIAIAGTSRRGLVASLVAFRQPQAVGNVIALSGSFYWRPAGVREWMWVPGLLARVPPRPVRFYLAAGELETHLTPSAGFPAMVSTNRGFRDVLQARGYDVTYVEFNGVHSELNWQDWLADGLVRLYARSPR